MSFEDVLRGYRLTTVDILYRMPDHPDLVQEFIWQEYDIAPRYPRITRFLDFWEKNLDGKLLKVKIFTSELIHPNDFHHVSKLYGLN